MANSKIQQVIKPDRDPGSFSSDLVKMISEARGGVDVGKPEVDDKAGNPFGWIDIITFCESPLYLGMTLHPWQRIILKIFYMGERGNHNLRLMDGGEKVCMNCAWSGNILRGESPCLRCSLFPEEMKERGLKQIEEMFLFDTDELEELRNCELTENFQTEMDMINTDLIDDSDARGGGSVRQQVISKIGNIFNHLILVLGRRSGKALALDTPVLTTSGWKTMGDLKIGESVFGSDGLPTRILAVTEVMNDRPCCEVSFSNGEKVVCDEDHEWPMMDNPERMYSAREGRDAVSKVRTTREILETQRRWNKNNHAIQLPPPLQFSGGNDLPIPPYTLGVWLGDGLSRAGSIVCFDDDLIESLVADGCNISQRIACRKIFTINKLPSGSCMKTTLIEMGLLRNKHIPSSYLRASARDRLELLCGLMDTDGHVTKDGKCEFVSTNPNLARDVFDLIVSLGIKVTMKEGDAKLYGRTTSRKHRMCFSPPSSLSVFHLRRKGDRLIRHGKRRSDIERVYVENVERVDPVPVRCIQVANDDGTYLVGRTCIPTHNSMLSSIICLYESYKLIEIGDPHNYYNITSGDPIVVLNVAVSEDQAKDSVFDKIRASILKSPYFKTKINPDSLVKRSVRFFTKTDEEQNEQLRLEGLPSVEGSIYLLSGTSNSDSQVGKSILVVVIDEMAAMVGKDSSKLSDRQLYEKLRHSVWTFPRDFKIICISNPLTTDGQFYELYEDSFHNDRLLMFQLPTNIVNPSIPKSELEKDKLDSIRKGGINEYIMNIQARFMGGAANPLIPASHIDEAFERGDRMRRAERGNPNQMYYMHVDPAYSSDNYALAIVHVEEDKYRRSDYGENERIVYVDHVQIWAPDKATGTPVDISTCDTYIADCSRRFRLASITYDQWCCLSIEQMIHSSRGLVRSGDLEVGDSLCSGDGSTNKIVKTRVVYDQPGFEITTKFGYKIECNDVHPIMTRNGFVKARSLSVGDSISVMMGDGMPFGDVHDVDRALLAGYLISEGCIQKQNFGFSNCDEEVLSDYCACFQRVFGREISPNENKWTAKQGWKRSFNVASSRKDEVSIISDIGISGLSHDKSVPPFVLRGDRETMSTFLSSLYEGDGHISLNRQVLSVQYDTVSEQLARQVHLLLLGFGIKASLKYFDNKFFEEKRCPFYRITMYGENISIFEREIGFRSSSKRERLRQCVMMQDDTETSKCPSRLSRGIRNHPKGRKSRSRSPWDKIVSITPKTMSIMNMEVDGDHTYVAGGIVSHNSAGSVQFLQKMGLPAAQTPFTSKYIQDIYSSLLDLFLQGRIVIYKHGECARETMEQLKFLQQKFNRRTFSISAAEGHHDDIPACIAGASFMALTKNMSYKGLPKIQTARINW